MSEYFPGPKLSGGRVKFEADLKNAAGIDTSKFDKKVD